MTRRAWILAICTCAAVLVGAASSRAETAPGDVGAKSVRLAIVNTPKFSGLIDALADDFKSASGIGVEIYSGSDVYEKARNGEADLVISHYGKAEVERFVLDGFGLWPRTVFSNQLAIIGPQSDPAKIKGLTSAAEALRKIASANAPFVANELHGVTYLSNILWDASGQQAKGAWYLEPGEAKGKAMQYADTKQAYVIWGALPFLRWKSKHHTSLALLVTGDPMFQRVMASIRVNPEKVKNINSSGAEEFEKYLLSPHAQAKIASFRTEGSSEQLWWPAGRNNAAEGLDE